MERNAAPDDPAPAGREALAARERADDDRSRLADERERRAERREADADQRERTANEREALADAREREADRREAAEAGRRQQYERRERELDERGQALGAALEGLEQRVLGTIEQSRALLALSAQRLDRQEAGVNRSRAHRDRDQAEINRAAAETEGQLAEWLPDPGSLIERGHAARKRARLAIQALASNEDETARLFHDLAARKPERREEYLHQAQLARAGAQRAREILTTFTD